MDFIGYMDYIGSSVFQGLPIVYSPEYTESMDSIESKVNRVHGLLYRAQSIQGKRFMDSIEPRVYRVHGECRVQSIQSPWTV